MQQTCEDLLSSFEEKAIRTVRTRAAREKAVELAKSAKPGVAVNDKIEVKPGA
jgi:hypothetical protein